MRYLNSKLNYELRYLNSAPYIDFISNVVKINLQIGGKRVEVAAQKGNTYSLSLLFGGKNKAA